MSPAGQGRRSRPPGQQLSRIGKIVGNKSQWYAKAQKLLAP